MEIKRETKWYLPPGVKTKWKKRIDIPQWYIDLLNTGKAKVALNTKDWKGIYGTAK